MDIRLKPSHLEGCVQVIPSKSQAHRLLICAAFADRPTTLFCPETNRDIEATAGCLRALGAVITHDAAGYTVIPINKPIRSVRLECGESGSTLRFMLPVVGALGVDATFLLEGRLPQRPLSPLWEEMERMGCRLSRPQNNTLRCEGKLLSGKYSIRGDVSSQFISGLLMGLSLLSEESTINIEGKTESRPYIDLTRHALTLFGSDPDHPGGRNLVSPGSIQVEGDWSNGAFFLAASSLGSKIQVQGLDNTSFQGDRAADDLIPLLQRERAIINASDIPDLVPILSVIAGANHGAVFTGVRRLRMKESDRIASVIAMLSGIGGHAESTEDTLTVYPAVYTGGEVDSMNDHRIAMSAAIAATVCTGPVLLRGAECVEKSYPRFWDIYSSLGGKYELYLR